MPTDRKIGKYNHETGKVEWFSPDEIRPPENKGPAVEGVKEIRAAGLPGQPVFTSRKSYERAVRDAGYVVVGNDRAAAPPDHAVDRINKVMRDRNTRGHK